MYKTKRYAVNNYSIIIIIIDQLCQLLQNSDSNLYSFYNPRSDTSHTYGNWQKWRHTSTMHTIKSVQMHTWLIQSAENRCHKRSILKYHEPIAEHIQELPEVDEAEHSILLLLLLHLAKLYFYFVAGLQNYQVHVQLHVMHKRLSYKQWHIQTHVSLQRWKLIVIYLLASSTNGI